MFNPPFKTEFGKFSRDQRSPAITKSGTVYFPVWLASATGVLEQAGFDVRLIDACADLIPEARALEIVQEYAPDMAVINTSTPSIYTDVAFAAKIKVLFPKCIIVLVGTHPSALPEETMALSQTIDVVARREYDYTLRELAQAIQNGKDFDEIAGITFRERSGNNLISNPDRSFIENLDELPFVSGVYKRHLSIQNYFFAAAAYPMLMIFTGRGCPNRCFFCVYPQVFHGRDKYRLRSPENVVAEFEYILENFPEVRAVGIEDDTFTADIDRTRKICELLIAKGIHKKINWWVNARVTLDYETMALMKQAGCNLLIAGFESGNASVLQQMHKGIAVEQSIQYAQNARKSGLRVHGCFMVGNPGDTRETMKETLSLALRLNPDTAQFFPLMVYPGTQAYEWAKQNGLLRTEDYSRWVTEEGLHNCVISLPDISSEELVAFCDAARRRYYLRISYIMAKVLQVVRSREECQRIFKSARRFVGFLLRRAN